MKLRVTTPLTSILFICISLCTFLCILSTTTISEAIYVDFFVHFKSNVIDSLLVLQQIKSINKRMKGGLNVKRHFY